MENEGAALPAPKKTKLSAFRSDLKTQADGAWVDIPEVPGFRLRVRGSAYSPFQTELRIVRARLFRKYPGKTPVPPELEAVENGRLYAKHLLLEWDGLEEAYAPELAMQALTDPEMIILRGQVAWAADQVGLAPIEAQDVLGNSNGGSAGNSASVGATPSGSNG